MPPLRFRYTSVFTGHIFRHLTAFQHHALLPILILHLQRHCETIIIKHPYITKAPGHDLTNLSDVHLMLQIIVIHIFIKIHIQVINKIAGAEIHFRLNAKFNALAMFTIQLYTRISYIAEQNTFNAERSTAIMAYTPFFTTFQKFHAVF